MVIITLSQCQMEYVFLLDAQEKPVSLSYHAKKAQQLHRRHAWAGPSVCSHESVSTNSCLGVTSSVEAKALKRSKDRDGCNMVVEEFLAVKGMLSLKARKLLCPSLVLLGASPML